MTKAYLADDRVDLYMAVDFVHIHVPQRAEHVHIGVQLSEHYAAAAVVDADAVVVFVVLYDWWHQYHPLRYCCYYHYHHHYCQQHPTVTTNFDNEPFGRDRMIYCMVTIQTNHSYGTFHPTKTKHTQHTFIHKIARECLQNTVKERYVFIYILKGKQ